MNPITLFRSALFPPKPFEAEIERQFLCDYSARHVTRRRVAGTVALCVGITYFGTDLFDAINDKQFCQVFINKILPLRLLGTAAMAVSAWLTFKPLLKTSERYANFCSVFRVMGYVTRHSRFADGDVFDPR
ncbi:hypothetical protein [Methyloglobulus sp.]|jgi:hypothetical protein|uniref:hypothetical protein n=1 Tax=Methyloglobulus sp. TaxID=2518622 RepID=UPI0032B7BC0C